MNRIKELFKKDLMLSVSLAAAIISLFITPPDRELLTAINWKTLATLFMLLSVLEGFKKENIFVPVLKKTGTISRIKNLTVFFIGSVFFSSMFVTNDVSLIIFVPLTIILFKAGGKEKYILPVLTMENIAAIRGSLLMPFGSPQNLFLFTQSGVSVASFVLRMLPLWGFSAILLYMFILFLFRKDLKESTGITTQTEFPEMDPKRRPVRILYGILFTAVILTIITRTRFWPYITVLVLIALLVFDRKVLVQTDYVLLLTFLCFFIFSASICKNPVISDFLKKSVAGHEYFWSIALSQVISNVPASIVLWPFSTNLTALLYGLDSAGLCSIIGSLASVINLRLYLKEYPGKGIEFIKVFQIISLIFFAIVVIPQYLLLACK
ncbi:MAG: SLC13 family permease [Treponema sp.]|nr:SLC13 family permease [Treponema sp.]